MNVQRIKAEELAERVKSEKVVLIDARNLVEYEEGHVPGTVPIDAIEPVLKSFPKDVPIVVTCNSIGELKAAARAEKLVRKGFTRVQVLYGGLQGWKDAGFEIEVGD